MQCGFRRPRCAQPVVYDVAGGDPDARPRPLPLRVEPHAPPQRPRRQPHPRLHHRRQHVARGEIDSLFINHLWLKVKTRNNCIVILLFTNLILSQSLPHDAEYIATLNVKVSIPESLEGENFGDLVSSVLKRMADFKEDCLKRQASSDDLNLGDSN